MEDYAGVAARGAAACRAALAAARGTDVERAPVPRPARRGESLGDVIARTRLPGRAQSARGIPAYFDPDEDVPVGEEPPDDDWR
jgi:hypothetical protein